MLLLLPIFWGAASGEGGAKGSYHELFYQQTLNHFSPLVDNRWQQRYLLNNDSWNGRGRLRNGCRGPILMYAGNEGNIEGFWEGNSFMIDDVAPQLGALLVFPEQRFYGKSQPFGTASNSLANLRFLTTSQVLEDYVELLDNLKRTLPDADRCPVVVFGGSYGGTLAAILRASRPAAITGALAASSELGYYDVEHWPNYGVDEFSFEDVVVKMFENSEPGCLAAIKSASFEIEGKSREYLIKRFNLCDDRGLGPNKGDLFAYVLEGLPQSDYPYSVGGLPAKPVDVVCKMLVDGHQRQDLMKAASEVVRLVLGDGDKCIPFQDDGLGSTPGGGPGPGMWGWQSCTETLHSFSSRALRNFTFNYSASAAECVNIFGDHHVRPDVGIISQRFGGFNLVSGKPAISRIIWSHGTLDPWHGWFQNLQQPPLGSDVHHVVMEGAAHHLDLRGTHPADPPSVERARLFEKNTISRWIREAADHDDEIVSFI